MALHPKVHHASITRTRMKNRLPLVYGIFAAISALYMVSPGSSEWLSLGLMICAGIPHGSFDLRVAEAKWRGSQVSKISILIAYLVGVAGMSGLCVFYPLLGLSLFLIISAAHFAEGESGLGTQRDLLRGLLFGVGAILLPIGLHFSEARLYLSYFISESTLDLLAPSLSIAALATTIALSGMLGWDVYSPKQENNRDTIERIVCLTAWILLPPLSGFAVWFIGRHSYQHLVVCQKKFAKTRAGIPFDFFAISALAIVGLLPFAMRFDFSKIDQLFAATICLIAGLTLPHMIVCHDIDHIADI
jgi:Brp/Blh family beta-carotene 15,15'-monooxygenase